MRSADLRQIFRQVLSISLLSPLVAASAGACGGSLGTTVDDAGPGGPGTDAGGSGDGGGSRDAGGGSCKAPNHEAWSKPGCGRTADLCITPDTPVLNCYSVVCGCSGKVISGCGNFPEPYVALPGPFGPDRPFPAEGSACNPNPTDGGIVDSGVADVVVIRDAAFDACVGTPQPVLDAGLTCSPWTVPLPCDFPADAALVNATQCQAYCGPNANWCWPSSSTANTLQCDPGCAVGRRPEGFTKSGSCRRGDADSITGIYFAAMAELEAASVFAFERLERELEAHGAPTDLRRRARRAAEDEKRHARVATSLAKRFGGAAQDVTPTPIDVRSLEAMALENAVEGCVRETFGALSATLQADRAGDLKVRAAMRRIATDETAHACLAWSVAEWLESQLDADARERVHAARVRAIAELREELCIIQPSVLREVAGLPSAAEAHDLLDALNGQLWAA